MDKEQDRLRQLAQLASTALHPYVVFSLVIALVSYEGSSSILVWAKWTAVALLSAYVLPMSYMQTRMAIAARTSGAQISLRSFFREKPNEMLSLACLFGIPSALVLHLLHAPLNITATVIVVSITSVLIALVNRVYRASFHLALFTSMTVPLVFIFGLPSLVLVPFFLLLGFSRYILGEHTPKQLVTGFFIGLLVSFGTFGLFGLLS
jgi:membrane-associated phospholipid phosphatase